MARRMVARAGGASCGARLRAAGLLVALGVLLVACASSGPSSATAGTPTTPTGLVTGTPTNDSGSPTPTLSPGSVAQSGSLDICQPVTPTPVQIGVPAEIPVYQGGQLKLAEANSATNTAEFGFCISGTVSAVGTFYTQALPGKGWGAIKTYSNLGTENITATRGSSEMLTITISPDTLQSGNTDLLIILQGQ